jgi:hypothetical protein
MSNERKINYIKSNEGKIKNEGIRFKQLRLKQQMYSLSFKIPSLKSIFLKLFNLTIQ